MPTTFTSATLNGSYDDDFDKDKHFHQILFNSGRALQARELTQLQTLIYQEIGRFGRNIFKEGASVSSGGMAINSSYEYVKIASTNSGGEFKDIPAGTIFRDLTTDIEAKVLEVRPRNTTTGFTVDTLYIQYIDAGGNVVSGTPSRFGDSVTLFDQSGTGYELVTDTPNAAGRAVRFDVETGDFFVLGRFVNASKQSLILNPYDQSFTGSVGFKVVQDVVTVSDDNSLYDNTGGVTNTASPGADRYRISLTLVDKADTTTDDTFLFLANIENSKITEEVEEDDAYNKINDLLANRTSDESGDYVVNPFTIHYEENTTDANSLDLIVSAGTAYVKGYRVDNPSPIKLTVPKPQETENYDNDVVPISYGNYLLIDSGRGAPDLDYSTVNFSTSATDPSTNTIGTARIRTVEKLSGGEGLLDGATHKAYLFDVNIDSGADISLARSIGTSANNLYKIRLNDTRAVLNDTKGSTALFQTTRPRLATMGDIVLRVQRRVLTSAVSAGTVDINAELGVGETFVDDTNWIVAEPNVAFVPHTVSSGVITVDTSLNGTQLEVLYYVQKTAALRTKTLTENVTGTLNLVESDGVSYYTFPHVDIFDVDSARNTDASGIDMLGSFTLDDGQRDNFYGQGRLILDADDSAPAQIYVKYSRLAHGATGDFFAAPSYNGLEYNQIPTHVTAKGQELNLFNFVDFRSDKVSGSFTNLNLLPKNGDDITADIEYYLPRNDKLLVTVDGEVQLLMGQQAPNPQFKPTPENALELYKIRMNPNTLDEEDLTFTQIEHPHYTMKDIAALEAKVDRLEEYTRLSILELNQRIDPLFDSAGNERVEVGSTADDFTDHSRTDTENVDHCASIDPEGGGVRACGVERNIRLVFDNSRSAGVTKKGDNIYLSYDSEEWAFQNLASTHVKVNPFGSTQNIGTLKLSPSSDEWRDQFSRASRAIKGDNKLSTKQAHLWNNWQWNWSGRSADEREEKVCGYGVNTSNTTSYSDPSDRYTTTTSNTSRVTGSPKHVSRVVASETLRARFGNRYVDYALIPWIRSRKIYFHAKGLKPNTKFTPFFDGVDVSDWCREETTFVRWADRDDEIGNRYGYSTLAEHPDGKSDLVADANGEVIGSFFIPSIRQQVALRRQGKLGFRKGVYLGLRFRAGVREFMLLDINTPDWEEAGSKAFQYYTAFGWGFGLWRWHWTRWAHSPYPFSYLSRRARTLTSKEIKKRLDAIAAGNINIIEPQLTGQYGGSTVPLTGADLNVIANANNMSTVLSDYITVNQNQQASSTVAPQLAPENPLSQTFYVDNPFGLVLTKVDLFFRAKDGGSLPVSIEIRPVENGKPSETNIVPDSQVFLNASEVDAIGTEPTLSTIQARPTTFEFEEPIHLQPYQRYAICVKSASTDYELFSAQTQQPVLGSTSRTVTTQPIPGSLFLPANGTVWKESKDQDLMYRLTRAKFTNGNGSVIMKNAILPKRELEENTLYTTKDTTIVVVSQEDHGYKTGDSITLSGLSGTLNGIPSSELNGTHVVKHVDAKHVVIGGTTQSVITTNATESGRTGGTQVLAPENYVFYTANLQLEHSIPRSTSIDTSAKFTSGSTISGSQTRFTQDPRYGRITPRTNIDFTTPRAIYQNDIEEAQLGAGERSLYVKVDFRSSNDYVSPIIDLQRTSMTTIGYALDDRSVESAPPAEIAVITPVIEKDDTQPGGCSSPAVHVSTPVELMEPAVGINIKAMESVPEGSNVDVYYRTCGPDEDIEREVWVYQEPMRPIPKSNDQASFVEAEYMPGGVGGTLKPFYKAQTKFVLKGSGLSPCVKDLRIKFLAT